MHLKGAVEMIVQSFQFVGNPGQSGEPFELDSSSCTNGKSDERESSTTRLHRFSFLVIIINTGIS